MKGLSQASLNIDGQPMFKYLDRAKELERQGKHLVHMELGDPDFATPHNIIEAAYRSLYNGGTHYCSSFGLPDFRETIREHVKTTRGFTPDLNQVLVTPGANVGIFYAVFCLVDPGCEVIVPDPGFSTYYSTIKMCGAKAVRVPLLEKNQFRMNPEDIEKAITDKTRLIIINSPNNPTGSVMTMNEIRLVYEIAKKHNVYIYSDEIYSRMNYEHSLFYSPTVYDECKEYVILSDGFSKSFAMTGWRLGMMVGPEKVIERMSSLLQTTSSCVSPFIQEAGKEALEGSQEEVYNMMREFKERRKLLVSGLNKIKGFSCVNPGGAFYVFPNITGTGLSSEEVFEGLLEAGVVSCPGNCFGEHGEGYVRLCYATSRDNIRLALQRIEKWADGIRS